MYIVISQDVPGFAMDKLTSWGRGSYWKLGLNHIIHFNVDIACLSKKKNKDYFKCMLR